MNVFPHAFRRLLLPAFALLVAGSAPAQIIISTAPYTITQAGAYRVGANLSVSAADYPVIYITVPNVELDLGGYTLTAPVSSSGYNVLQIAAVSNVTIRNGTVVGSSNGILFEPGNASSNHLVENVRVVGSSSVGIWFVDDARGSVVRNNVIVNAGNPARVAYGILTGGGVLIMDNAIGKVTGSSGNSYGIYAAGNDFIIGNTVNECAVGIQGGKYLNNLTNGCTTPFRNGVNAAGNN